MADLFKTIELELHPQAFPFPPMTGVEYKKLKQSIKKEGLLMPILLYEGKIIDGWHRYNICKELNIPPRTEEYQGDNPFGHSYALNLFRRQLTPFQRGIIAKRFKDALVEVGKDRMKKGGSLSERDPSLLSMVPEEIYKVTEYNAETGKIEANPNALPPIGDSFKVAAKASGSSPNTISFIDKLEKQNPDLLQKGWEGRASLSYVRKEIQKAENRELSGQIAADRKEYVEAHGHKFFYGRLGGDDADKRGYPRTDESDEILEAWLGTPEVGFLLSMKWSDENKHNGKAVISITLTQTRGGKKWVEETEVLYDVDFTMETYGYTDGFTKPIYLNA